MIYDNFEFIQLDVNYYCGNCDKSSEPSNLKKCTVCNKPLVKWYYKLVPKSYIKDLWIRENEEKKFNMLSTESGAFFIVGIGVFIAIIVLILFLNVSEINFNKPIDSLLFSHFGDIIGGLVGVIWSLAGIVLFYIALNNQIKNSEINQELLLTQISVLNNQLQEYKESIDQTKRIAKANEATQMSLNRQLTLTKENLELDKLAILVDAFVQLSRNEPNSELKNDYLLKAKGYLRTLTNKIEDERN